jgi:hypothetical protein
LPRKRLESAGFVNIRTLAAPVPSPLILADKPAKSRGFLLGAKRPRTCAATVVVWIE